MLSKDTRFSLRLSHFSRRFRRRHCYGGAQSLEEVRKSINKLLEFRSFRFVLNLKKLNRFIQTKHFKLKDDRTAAKLIFKNDFLTKLDLENTYLLISIDESSSKYLRFIFQGQHFEFLCLPFDLNAALYLFTKILKPIVYYL